MGFLVDQVALLTDFTSNISVFLSTFFSSTLICLSRAGPTMGTVFHWTDFREMLYWRIFKNLLKKFKFHYNMTRMEGTLHGDRYVCTFTVSRSVLLRMRNVSDRSCRENNNKRYVR